MPTCLVTQNLPAIVIVCFFLHPLRLLGVAQLPEKFFDAPLHVARVCNAPKPLQLLKILQPFLDLAIPGLALRLPSFAPPFELGLLHHRHDTQSAKRLGLLQKKWLRMWVSWPHTHVYMTRPKNDHLCNRMFSPSVVCAWSLVQPHVLTISAYVQYCGFLWVFQGFLWSGMTRRKPLSSIPQKPKNQPKNITTNIPHHCW